MALPFPSVTELKHPGPASAQLPPWANLAVICDEHLWFNKVTSQFLCLSQLKHRVSLGKHLLPIIIKIKNTFVSCFVRPFQERLNLPQRNGRREWKEEPRRWRGSCRGKGNCREGSCWLGWGYRRLRGSQHTRTLKTISLTSLCSDTGHDTPI